MTDILFPELRTALQTALNESSQSEAFKRQMISLVENAYRDNGGDARDVEALLEIITSEPNDGD